MRDNDKTAQELIAEFQALMFDSSSENAHKIPPVLRQASQKFIEERVYHADAHAELGRHVEAVMKYFRELN